MNELVQLEKEKLASAGERNVDGVGEGITVMKSLPIIWQRLVTAEGKTCDRCDATYQEMQRAVSKLKESLRPLGIAPTLETRVIDEESFKANPSASNRMSIADRPLEEWLGARIGGSQCCSVCGDSECRTVEIGGTVFEAIPEELILKAALVAAAQLIAPTSDGMSSQSEFVSGKPKCCEESR